MTTMKILQGADQIGGNIVKIEGKNTRLIIDFGIPVTNKKGNPTNAELKSNKMKKYLPDIPDLYKNEQEKETFIFISHAHPDHYGLLRFVNKTIPIYTTKITKKLILTTSKLLYNNIFDKLNIRVIENHIETKDFIIKPIAVNHSVGGACAFKIYDKLTHKTILYSGDLRNHGRSETKLENKPDYLIMEGTTLSRKQKSYISEEDIENRMYEIFKEDKLNLVCFSPLNEDRMISVYNACKRAEKTLVIDPYTALILEKLDNPLLPKYNSEFIKVFCINNKQSKIIFADFKNKIFGTNKIKKDDLLKNPENYIIKYNFRVFDYLRKNTNLNDCNICYSYWEGYLEDKKMAITDYPKQIQKIHTSGHIFKTDLINLVKKINPGKIIPIHTLSSKSFKDIFKTKTAAIEELYT